MIHTLNVRYQNLASETRKIAIGDLAELEATKRAVVFIHGFANSEDAAEKKYRRMHTNLADLASGLVPYPRIDYFGFHWPGNHRLIGINQLTFNSRVGIASSAGSALAATLAYYAPQADITLVAHSLGCRVALSCLTSLLQNPLLPSIRPTVSTVVLMAAAVPWKECKPGEEPYGARYGTTRYLTLYSGNDAVLLLGFPAGQSLVDRPGRAVGRWGQPFDHRWDDRRPTNLGHGAYWKDDIVAGRVAHAMRIAKVARLTYTQLALFDENDPIDVAENILPALAPVGG